MDTDANVRDLFDRLAEVDLLDVPVGESGIPVQDEKGILRQCVPILSVYLDTRPLLSGHQPAARASRMILRERLHQIAQTFWPRGMAYDTVLADANRIEAFLDAAVSPATQGVAIFAGAAHHLFETFLADVPFENHVSALAMPDLFQLADLLDDHEVAVVAVVHTHAARLFVTHRGGMREVRKLSADPKLFHQVRRTNAMNQAHYQRHAGEVRAEFAGEVADEIERLAQRTGATEVIIGGDAVAVPILRQAIEPKIAHLMKAARIPLNLDSPRHAIWEDIEPLLLRAQNAYEHAAVVRLVEAIQAGGLGVAGYVPTRAAVEAGQADTLVIAKEAPLSEGARSELVALAARTGAQVEIIDADAALDALGSVGALLRYRMPEGTPQDATSVQGRQEHEHEHEVVAR